ncbi:MAG: S-layer homology domain-containing protein [Firmicutes bacterium]|nr:S-layer homology domain-containing protein [Bacillota bacterium]
MRSRAVPPSRLSRRRRPARRRRAAWGAAAAALALAALAAGAARPRIAALLAPAGARPAMTPSPARPPRPSAPPVAAPQPAPLPGAGPDRVSRAQLAVLLAAAWNLTPTDIGPAYRDVGPGTPGRAAIEAAAGAGDFGPDPGGAFRPAAAVTRLFLAEALVDALGLGPEASLLADSPPPVRDAAAIPRRDWGSARLAVALALVPAEGGSFRPTAPVTPAQATAAVARARSLTPWDLAPALAPLATRVDVRAAAAATEPDRPVAVSATVRAGELVLPVPVVWRATGGVVAQGALFPTVSSGAAVVRAQVPGGRASGEVRVRVEAPARLRALSPPPAVLADQRVTFAFAVATAGGETVTADGGRAVRIQLRPPAGPAVAAVPLDRAGVVRFSYRPSVLGTYVLTASAPHLSPVQVRFSVVPARLGALSLLVSAPAAVAGGRLAVDGAVATPARAGRLPDRVPVTLTAVLRRPDGGAVGVGRWQGEVGARPLPLARLASLPGPGTLVLDLSSPGGALAPARALVPVAPRGRLSLAPAQTRVTAGQSLVLTATAPGAPQGTALSLAMVAPDGAPLAPVAQLLSHGRAQFLLTPHQSGRYRLEVSGPGLLPAQASLFVLPGPAAALRAALASPFPPAGQGPHLVVAAVDGSGNPVPVPAIDIAWRYAQGGDGWRRTRLAGGGTLALPPARGSSCAVAVRLTAPGSGLPPDAQVLPCREGSTPGAAAFGPGLFLSYWVARDASPRAIVNAALKAGVRTLYVEVAIPGTGFWGQPGLDRLLPVAHESGIAVLAWVPANLRRPDADLATARAALAYRTPDGLGVDGLAADFEGDLDPHRVAAYLRALRSAAGPERALCAVAPMPTRLAVPYAAMARYADVLMPMAYWQANDVPVAYAGAYRTALSAVALVRSQAPSAAVVPILQGYDPDSAGGSGVYSPGLLAERGALAGALAAGARGVAFFQWGTLTPAEWRAVRMAAAMPFGRTAVRPSTPVGAGAPSGSR